MNQFWTDHWWLLIPLGAFTIPLAGIALGGLATWLDHRHRAQVLKTVQTYVQAGKEPPPELLRALGQGGGDDGEWRWKWQEKAARHSAAYTAGGAAANAGAAAGAAVDAAFQEAGRYSRWSDPEAIRARAEYHTARAAARSARWRQREPLRRWNNAIFLAVGAAALYFASQHYASDRLLSDRLEIGALIVGALAVAGVLAAILATIFRPE